MGVYFADTGGTVEAWFYTQVFPAPPRGPVDWAGEIRYLWGGLVCPEVPPEGAADLFGRCCGGWSESDLAVASRSEFWSGWGRWLALCPSRCGVPRVGKLPKRSPVEWFAWQANPFYKLAKELKRLRPHAEDDPDKDHRRPAIGAVPSAGGGQDQGSRGRWGSKRPLPPLSEKVGGGATTFF
jgi:hypothetical protein